MESDMSISNTGGSIEGWSLFLLKNLLSLRHIITSQLN